MRQRRDLLEYADGLIALFTGEDCDEADAAACNIAEVLIMIRQSLRAKE